MNNLEIDNLEQLIMHINARAREGAMPISALLLKLQEIYMSVERGCPCRKKQRAGHARAVYRDTMINATIADKRDLGKMLGLGQNYKLIAIKDDDTTLLKLGKE